MTGEDIKRFVRAMVFLLVALFILFLGMLPGDFTTTGLEISPYLYAWSAAFIVKRPRSSGIIVIVLTAIMYMVYNDAGVALGSLAYLLFCVSAHEVRPFLENQSFLIEDLTMSLVFFASQLLKNLILQLFFTHSLPLMSLIKFAFIFALGYAGFAFFINLIFGSRNSKQVTPN